MDILHCVGESESVGCCEKSQMCNTKYTMISCLSVVVHHLFSVVLRMGKSKMHIKYSDKTRLEVQNGSPLHKEKVVTKVQSDLCSYPYGRCDTISTCIYVSQPFQLSSPGHGFLLNHLRLLHKLLLRKWTSKTRKEIN